MEKVLIFYSSQTFNTADAATALHKELTEQVPQMEFVLANVKELAVDEILQYTTVIFGTSTWDDAHNPDTEEFLQRVDAQKPDFSKMNWALFGLGDSSYPEFCGAVPLVKAAIEPYGAQVYDPFFFIDGYPTDPLIAGLTEWAKQFLSLKNNK